MTERTRVGLCTMAAAALLGLLGDMLLRVGPWGLNFAVWSLVSLVAVVVAARLRRGPLAAETYGLLAVAALFSLAFVWRDSPVLKQLDAGAFVLALSLAALRTRAGRLRLAGVAEYARGVMAAADDTAGGAWSLVARDVAWSEMPRDGVARHARSAGVGLLLALPVVALFGALLMNADAVFAGLASRVFSFNVNEAVSHLAWAGAIAWGAAGLLRGVALGDDLCPDGGGREKRPSLGIVEIGMVLAVLDLLFAVFVAVQVRYLFGGSPLVQVTPGLTYAAYARKGFFELAAVAALALPLLLGLHASLRTEGAWDQRLFRALSWLFLGMLAVIIASAMQRMRLYVQVYGLTELRLYVWAAMVWLGVEFAWLGWTVLRGRRPRFALGSVVATLAGVAALNVLNPDAVIVHWNSLGRHRMDAGYAAGLSADAAPELERLLPALKDDERRLVVARLRALGSERSGEWRDWSLSRAAARRVAERVAPAEPGKAPENALRVLTGRPSVCYYLDSSPGVARRE